MSRWDLLRSALVNKEQNHSHVYSIHKFQGFELFDEPQKILWAGFCFSSSPLHCNSETDLDQIVDNAITFMESIDCAEVVVRIVGQLPDPLPENVRIANVKYRHDHRSLNLASTCDGINESIHYDVFIKHPMFQPVFRLNNFFLYEIPVEVEMEDNVNSNVLSFVTREPVLRRSPNLQGLASNQIFDVDNTGNVRVWPSERILLHVLLNSTELRSLVRGKRLLELGGGSTGFAGIGLAVAGLPQCVSITDGHPHCVVNQKTCIAMNQQRGYIQESYPITSTILHWRNNRSSASLEEQTTLHYDVIIAADCLFFKDFHLDLLSTIKEHLANDGVVMLLQPNRHNTMNFFLGNCQEEFEIEIRRDYSQKMSALRFDVEQSEATSKTTTIQSGYNEDIHYPLLVLLRRRKKNF